MEGAALREDDGNGGSAPGFRPAPAWGHSHGNGDYGSAPSWTQPAFGIGRAASAKPVTTERQSDKNAGFSGGQTPRPNPQVIPQSDIDLLPHERLARENMLKRENQEQRRKVRIHSGSGPEYTRGGRPLPYTAAERSEMSQANLGKMRAQERESESVRMDGYKIRKRTSWNTASINEPDSRLVSPSQELPKWSMLKRKGQEEARTSGRIEGVVQDSRLNRDIRYTTDRAQREEQAKSGRYIPLSRRVELRNASNPMSWATREAREALPVSERQVEAPRNVTGRVRFVQDLRHPRTQSAHSGHKRETEHPQVDTERDQHSLNSQPLLSIRRPVSNVLQEDWSDGSLPDTPIDGRYSGRESDIRRNSNSYLPKAERNTRFSPMVSKEQEKLDTKIGEVKEIEEQGKRGEGLRKAGRYTEKAAPAYEDAPRGKGRDKARRRQKFTEELEDYDAQQEAASQRAELKRRRKAEKAAQKAAAPTPILLPEYISVSNLAVALKVRLEDFIEKLGLLGFEETSHDYILNAENAGLIAMEYNFEAIIDKGDAGDLKAREPAPDPSILPQRPPVVTIMGHVDHGKTTLLDWLRKSSVAATEHGGITQHIGAFSVPMPSGKIITFLDTPGHAAFLSMRQRGANVTDIVILVVAADDSVKPQTIEAIKHAQAAKVPIIVAINKIDKEESNVDRVKQDLARHGLDVEDFGGETQAVCVSGKTGQGMDKLEEAVVTLSEIIDMRAEIDGPAEGWVLEASIKSMGKVATVLVRRGTTRPGDFIIAGKTWARIRCLRNEAGMEIEEAGPGTPVEIDGWRELPLAGDEVLQAIDEAKAKSVVEHRLEKEERDKMAQDMEAINDNRKAEQDKREREKAEALAAVEASAASVSVEQGAEKFRDKSSGTKEIFFIVKGDVSGSVEAVVDSISVMGNKEVRPHVLRSGVGQLSEFDIEHAAAANGILVNFNTNIEPKIAQLAAHSKVSILDHNIIYRLVDDVKAELSKHLPPLVTTKVLGEAEIAEVFQITIKGRKQKPIAGSKVRNGTISKNAKVRVLRNGETVFDGVSSASKLESHANEVIGLLSSLKNVKKDVMEMKKGTECGIGFEDWSDFRVGDHMQSYEERLEKRYL